jgi:hypothetical protein
MTTTPYATRSLHPSASVSIRQHPLTHMYMYMYMYTYVYGRCVKYMSCVYSYVHETDTRISQRYDML